MTDTIEYKGYNIDIHQDDDASNPREEFDQVTSIVAFHRNYNFDKHDYRTEDYNTPEEMKADIVKNENAVLIKDLFMYEHSGIMLKTSAFDCQWDSGQLGVIYISADKAKEMISIRDISNISDEEMESLDKVLEGEVELFNQYLSGQVYGYTVRNDDEVLDDSCWGYYGDPEESGLLEAAKDAIDWHIKSITTTPENLSARQSCLESVHGSIMLAKKNSEQAQLTDTPGVFNEKIDVLKEVLEGALEGLKEVHKAQKVKETG